MSSLNADQEQRWVPTHVQVTVVRGRGLRAKGKHGTSDVYTIIQVGKEKYSTCVVEKTVSPEWKEECSFELLPGVLEEGERNTYPPGSSDLVLTVMHRAMIGDVFLGQAVIPLDKAFEENICLKNEWFKLNSKTGKKEKERGEVQVTVQFTRNNLTASMYDLAMKDKHRSTFGKLKDRMRGKKRSSDEDPSSANLPGGQLSRVRNRLPSDGGGEEDYEDDEGGEYRRSKMRTFFLRGKLRKSSETRSSTSLGSESSESSSRGGSLSPTAGISVVVSDLSSSPSNNSNLTAENSPDHTADTSPKLSPLKSEYGEFGDEAGEISIAVPQPSLLNGNHVYGGHLLEPGSGKVSGSLFPLQKSLPLSLSLQNLRVPRPDELPRGPAGDGRRWSFDKVGAEEKAAIAATLEQAGSMLGLDEERLSPVAVSVVAAESERAGSGGKGQSQCKDESEQARFASEERHIGWFGFKDSHSKPSPHLVKPLAPGGHGEEKGRHGEEKGRSVLEKLKSTIHPGRSSPPSEQDPQRKKSITEGAGSYYHLTHNELVSLLLRREAELDKQKAEFARQGTLLSKREAELKKLKPQVRDLEDYIDTLLVRIMEQTPTLLQVRTKLK